MIICIVQAIQHGLDQGSLLSPQRARMFRRNLTSRLDHVQTRYFSVIGSIVPRLFGVLELFDRFGSGNQPSFARLCVKQQRSWRQKERRPKRPSLPTPRGMRCLGELRNPLDKETCRGCTVVNNDPGLPDSLHYSLKAACSALVHVNNADRAGSRSTGRCCWTTLLATLRPWSG